MICIRYSIECTVQVCVVVCVYMFVCTHAHKHAYRLPGQKRFQETMQACRCIGLWLASLVKKCNDIVKLSDNKNFKPILVSSSGGTK